MHYCKRQAKKVAVLEQWCHEAQRRGTMQFTLEIEE
jgi:hypothetical protein